MTTYGPEKFGVPEQYSSRNPQSTDTRLNFPRQFDATLYPLWQKAVAEVVSGVPQTSWSEALAAFLRLCREASKYPFAASATRNSDVASALMTSRRAIVRFLDEWGILSNKGVRVNEVSYHVSVIANGFSVRVTVPIWELEQYELEKWLKRNIFFSSSTSPRYGTSDYRKRLPVVNPLYFGAAWSNSHVTRVWYQANIPHDPYIPLLLSDLGHTPEFARTVFDLFWAPLVKNIKMKTAPSNLIF